jgi:hypothetical protein
MKSEKTNSPVFYGITASNKYPIGISKQKVLFKLLFLDINVSAAKARTYLNDNFYFLHIDFILERMAKEIDNWTSQEDKDKKNIHVEIQITEKLEHWIKEFSLPSPEEISELARIYNISETALNKKLYSLFESGKYAPGLIIDYLSKYSDNISNRLVDKLLDKYNSMKPQKNFLFKRVFSKAAIY